MDLMRFIEASLIGLSTSGAYIRFSPIKSGGRGYLAAHFGKTSADRTKSPRVLSYLYPRHFQADVHNKDKRI
jgi:hypothetical protein